MNRFKKSLDFLSMKSGDVVLSFKRRLSSGNDSTDVFDVATFRNTVNLESFVVEERPRR